MKEDLLVLNPRAHTVIGRSEKICGGQKATMNGEPGVWRHRGAGAGDSGFVTEAEPCILTDIPEAEDVTLAEKCLQLLLLICFAVFYIQIYSIWLLQMMEF